MKKPVISNSRGLWKLLVVVAGMFCFGFVLVPMYNAICQLVNLNGKDSAMLVSAKDVVEREDATRTVKVEFVTTVNGGRVFSFRAEQPSVQVHPGKLYTVDFVARNERDEAVIGQARSEGYVAVYLDTQPDAMASAYRLYLRLGFVDCLPYRAADPGVRFMRRGLAA